MGVRNILVVGTILAVFATGCGARSTTREVPRSPRDAVPSASIPRAGTAIAPAEQDAAPPNLEPPSSTSDRSILSLAAESKACTFDKTRGFVEECDAVERWEAETELFSNGRGDSALVWLLERGSEPERLLAASKLGAEGVDFRDDASLAGRVIGAGAREASEAVGAHLGHAIAAIDLAATNDDGRVVKLLTRPKNVALTVSLLEEIAVNNEPSPPLLKAIVRATEDDHPEIREAAVLGLGLSEDRVACPRWEKALSDTDASVALAAAHLVVTRERCRELLDPVLSFIGAGQRRGLFTDPVVASTLHALCDFDGVTNAQRMLAAALAEGFAATDLPVGLREEALGAALACSSDERRFVKRFTSDADPWLRRRAKDLLKERHSKRAPRLR